MKEKVPLLTSVMTIKRSNNVHYFRDKKAALKFKLGSKRNLSIQ